MSGPDGVNGAAVSNSSWISRAAKTVVAKLAEQIPDVPGDLSFDGGADEYSRGTGDNLTPAPELKMNLTAKGSIPAPALDTRSPLEVKPQSRTLSAAKKVLVEAQELLDATPGNLSKLRGKVVALTYMINSGDGDIKRATKGLRRSIKLSKMIAKLTTPLFRKKGPAPAVDSKPPVIPEGSLAVGSAVDRSFRLRGNAESTNKAVDSGVDLAKLMPKFTTAEELAPTRAEIAHAAKQKQAYADKKVEPTKAKVVYEKASVQTFKQKIDVVETKIRTLLANMAPGMSGDLGDKAFGRLEVDVDVNANGSFFVSVKEISAGGTHLPENIEKIATKITDNIEFPRSPDGKPYVIRFPVDLTSRL